jgi:acetylserotonin N-methyltransferase
VAAPFYEEGWNPPDGHDGVWFANTLHVESMDANASLLRRLYGALPQGGRIWIEERTRVPHDLVSSKNELTWMLHTARGRAYSDPEIAEMLARAGFVDIHNLARDPGEALFVAARA